MKIQEPNTKTPDPQGVGLTSASTPNTPRLAGREASTNSLARSSPSTPSVPSLSFLSLSMSSHHCKSSICFHHYHHPPHRQHFKSSIFDQNNAPGLVRSPQGCDGQAGSARRTCDSQPSRPTCDNRQLVRSTPINTTSQPAVSLKATNRQTRTSPG